MNKPWIQTYTGKEFTPFDPNPEDVDIEDISHALSNVCRFTGHVKEFYSVAEHSVAVAEILMQKGASQITIMWGLFHDASEAYISDISRPIKQHLQHYKEIEEGIMKAVAAKFMLPWPMPQEVKDADIGLLLAEKEQLLRHNKTWVNFPDDKAADIKIQCWSPFQAKRIFKWMYRGLENNTIP